MVFGLNAIVERSNVFVNKRDSIFSHELLFLFNRTSVLKKWLENVKKEKCNMEREKANVPRRNEHYGNLSLKLENKEPIVDSIIKDLMESVLKEKVNVLSPVDG